jgi:hypothetical protein
MIRRKSLFAPVAVAITVLSGPSTLESSEECFHCHNTCGTAVELCYAFEKCEGDYCEATMEESICENID